MYAYQATYLRKYACTITCKPSLLYMPMYIVYIVICLIVYLPNVLHTCPITFHATI